MSYCWRKLFRRISVLELMTVELEEAKRDKLIAESGREYAEAQVTYNEQRIKRLSRQINEATEKDKQAPTNSLSLPAVSGYR